MAVTSVRQFIAKRLIDTAAVVAYVGGATNPRIYQGEIPEWADYPMINYFQIGAPRLNAPNAQRDHFQINVRTQGIGTAETCWTIAEEVIASLFDYQGTTDSFDIQFCYYDDARQVPEPNNVYLTIIDIYVSYERK